MADNRSIIAVDSPQRQRKRNEQIPPTMSVRYPPSTSCSGTIFGQHWRIENKASITFLMWCLTRMHQRIAMEDAVENMALFRRFVLNIVKQSDCGAPSQRNKLKKQAGMMTIIGHNYSVG